MKALEKQKNKMNAWKGRKRKMNFEQNAYSTFVV